MIALAAIGIALLVIADVALFRALRRHAELLDKLAGLLDEQRSSAGRVLRVGDMEGRP